MSTWILFFIAWPTDIPAHDGADTDTDGTVDAGQSYTYDDVGNLLTVELRKTLHRDRPDRTIVITGIGAS